MARLDTDKQAKYESKRFDYAIEQLGKLGITDITRAEKSLKFTYKKTSVTLYPYSGWFAAKGFQDGRGIHELIAKLKKL